MPWIRELKTGAARIKLGADQHLKDGGIDEEVKIVPVGLNYSNPHRFQSGLLINIGEPIDFKGIDRNGEPKEVARQMTERIKQSMEDQVLHVEQAEHYPVIKAAMKLLTDTIMSEIGLNKSNHGQAFIVRKEIIRSIEITKKENPEVISKLEERLVRYVDQFEALGFRRFNPFETQTSTRMLLMAGAIIGAPFFALSMVVNGLPFLAARAAFMKLLLSKVTQEHKQGQINPAFAGSLAFSTGLAIFVLWYLGLIFISSMFMPWWIAWPVSWVLGYQLGRFALVYVRWIDRLRRIMRWNAFEKEDPDTAQELLKERSELISSLMEIYKGES